MRQATLLLACCVASASTDGFCPVPSILVSPAYLEEAKIWRGREFPLTLSPTGGSALSPAAHLLDWVKTHKSSLLQQTLSHGAVLLRGWDISALDFADVFEALDLEVYPYIGGAAPRNNVIRDVVFTTNESPPSEPIPFHHEMAQVPNPPNYVAFYCEAEPGSGGQTPIILSYIVADYFARKFPTFFAKVLEYGVRYVRVMPAQDDNESAIGRSWGSTFGAKTRQEAEEAMRKIGTTWEWLENGDCRTTTATVPALRNELRLGGNAMFFNAIVAAYTGWIDSRNDPTKSILIGDGTPLTPMEGAALLDIQRFQMAERTVFAWKYGDILLLDNHVSMHSRNPFPGGKRRILAAIGGRPQTRNNIPSSNGILVPQNKILRSGDSMPVLGFGMWKIPREATANVVYEAIKAGYRHLDAACDYGNEAEAGEGIARAIKEGLVTRSDLWITSKLWNTYHAPEHVELAASRSLRDLGIDYFDLYLVHFPIALRFVPMETRYPPEWVHDPEAADPAMRRMEPVRVPMHRTWAAMEGLADTGLARNIGVANMNVQMVRDMLAYAVIPPAVLQVELHPFLTQPKLLQFCREEGIVVTGFSPLGAGSYKVLGWTTDDDSALRHPDIMQIAAVHGVTPAQVLLRWAVQRGTSVVSKTTKHHRMQENLESVMSSTWAGLTAADMVTVNKLDRNHRFNDPGVFTLGMNTFFPIYE